MLCFASPDFQLVIACLSVLLASGLTLQQPAPVIQDPATFLSQSENDAKMLKLLNLPPGKVTDQDVEMPKVFQEYLDEKYDKVANLQKKLDDLEQNFGKNLDKNEKPKIEEKPAKESISETIEEKADNDDKAGIGDDTQSNLNNDEPSNAGNPIGVDKSNYPPQTEKDDDKGAQVSDQAKPWPWKQFGVGAVAGGVAGGIGGGAIGYYYGKKAGRLDAASGKSPAPGNETQEKSKKEEGGSPIWQLLVYVLASISAILLLIICVGVFAWFCTIDVEQDEKERSRKSRKSGKSKRVSVRTPNSQTPSTLETLGSTPMATSERVGSRKKSVKSQMVSSPKVTHKSGK